MADMWARSRLTASPPLRPATRASSDVNSWAVPLAWAARPPLLAISRCFDGSIDAKPRLLVEAIVSPFRYCGCVKRLERASRNVPDERGRKERFSADFSLAGGERGIRTLGRALRPYGGLANRWFQPLTHLSASWPTVGT